MNCQGIDQVNYYFITPDKNERTWHRLITRGARFLAVDGWLVAGILILETVSLFLLYSTGGHNLSLVIEQLLKFLLASGLMLILAKVPIHRYQPIATWFFLAVITILVMVLLFGTITKGGQRWFSLGRLRVQPAELMKLALPMMLAKYLSSKRLPLNLRDFLGALGIIVLPVLLIGKQPDLGTASLIALSGCIIILLAGIRWQVALWITALAAVVLPIGWNLMYDYQKMRLLTFLAPESDPLNRGYNAIQAKIALGSGGALGKGWLHGSQSRLHFLPEAPTDFAFAVYGEEFGFVGCMVLFGLFGLIIGRCLLISTRAQDTFSRLLVGGLSLSFFCSFFVNVGMVSSILPVVGVPLPFVSFGGSYLVIQMICFGIIISAHQHRKLIGS